MIDHFTVTRERPTWVDDGHGDFMDDWSDPDVLELKNCDVQPGATQEDLQNRDGVLVQWTVLAPGHPDVLATDRIVFDGVNYAIDGEPGRWPGSPAVAHTLILLKAWGS